MRRRTRLAALCLCACLALAGCGQPAPEEPSPPDTDTPAPIPTQAPEAVRFSLGYDPAASMHPITGDSQVNQELTGLVYQGLYELDNAFAPQPVLASAASVSEDGYVWTFTLAPGTLFSDGTPLTAQHAAASLAAARGSTLYGSRLSGVVSVAAVDELTLAVTLSAPNGALPALLDIPVVLEQEEGPPLGTGYYRYEASGGRMFLQANPYSPSTAALPYATIPLTAVSTAADRIAAFDSGDVTAVATDFSSPYALGYSSSYETCDYPTTAMLYVGFRTTGGPCQSALVRRAFSQAFDREELVTVQLAGHGDAAALPVSPLCGDYDPDTAALLDCDPEGAAQLLADAGYAPGGEDGLLYLRREALAVTLLVNSDNDVRQAIAAQLADALTQLGVSVTVSRLPWKDYTAALSRGDFDLYIGEVRLTGDFDPTALLAGNLNYGGYWSEELAPALAQWRGRAQTGGALWELLARDAPIAPLCFKRGSLLVRWGMVSNLQPTRANPYYHMEQWTTAG